MSLAYDILPLTLVTGFLGSGKSTLLADVLQGDAARDTAVLVNEFGDVGLDHLLIGEVDARTVLLDNGCVCCSIRGELKDALATLFSQRARGDVPPFSRVVLETTGLATPAPIIATLLADPVIRSHYALNATITVVDAVNAHEQHARYPEWLAQVTAADRLLISKPDLVDELRLTELARMLTALNPAADVLIRGDAATAQGVDGHDGRALLDILFASASSIDLIGRIGGAQRRVAVKGALAHRGEQASTIQSFCMQVDIPLDWQVFTLWFTMLLNRHGDKILRVKGLLCIADSDRPAVLHAVQHLVHPVLHLDAWPPAGEGPRRCSRLVFITESLGRDAIEASYARFQHHLEEAVH
ncbi:MULTISPECIES: CobW family GTP-binding protein [Burkholderiaceae]|uniref:Putative metal chaperone, involved in Zn homeostasis, GTPase of COG0523 family n=1 Tax=Caballeronia sordidicola TaxID=196367 RepID=A0A242N3B3_CABSO|nr:MULTISPECIES: GTP-binding protein [Burkholderiaceae]AMH43716.1 cobalamin synthesis protein P47K [Burkholderia sp. PAMC 26561]OTP78062.1 putative metal chaperone, involved in Zn homeostasis, GTPase of COG0523 family [Caballeronia sordidicola]